MSENNANKTHKCLLCEYSSFRKFDVKRHHNAKHKTKLYPIIEARARTENAPGSVLDVPPFFENVPQFEEIVPPIVLNVPPNEENVTPLYICEKCNKNFKHEKYFKLHKDKCKNVDSLTCPRCMKSFSSRQHKHKHTKADKCKPRSIIHAKNSHQNRIITNNYGSERIDYIIYDDVKTILMQAENTISKYIEKKHFHKYFPENNNIVYVKQNLCQVYEDNKWNEKSITSLASKLIKDAAEELLKFCNDNASRLSYDIQDDDIFAFIKQTLSQLEQKNYNKYKNVYHSVRELIINSQTTHQI